VINAGYQIRALTFKAEIVMITPLALPQRLVDIEPRIHCSDGLR
jgi:hypothetical protein